MKKRVLVAMSGGMDSSVTAALLKTQGYEVYGVYFQFLPEGSAKDFEGGGRCCNPIAAKKVEEICEGLKIPFSKVSAEERYNADVLDYSIHEYLLARKPNPCVICNSAIKFDLLAEKASDLKCDYIATGHYAKALTSQSDGCTYIYRPVDAEQDQTYFLFGIEQKILSKTLMPLGDFLKTNVKKLADTFGLKVPANPQETQICLIGDRGYKKVLESRTTERFRHPGHIIDQAGKVLGRHAGLYRHFVGQNKGLNILTSSGRPDDHGYFVIGFDLKLNSVIVGNQSDLLKSGAVVTRCNWIGPVDFQRNLRLSAKISATAPSAECSVSLMNNNSVIVQFDEPQYAITPGQALVLYHGDQLLGGGWIENLTQPVVTSARSLKDLHGA